MTTTAVLRLQSVVARAKSGAKFTPSYAYENLSCSEQRLPSGGPIVRLRVGTKSRYVGVYRNGTLEVRGARSISEARISLLKAATILTGDRSPTLRGFKITNLVATTDLERRLSLARLFEERAFESTSYEPEVFPGLIAKIPDSHCTALVFSSGKVVLVGAKSLDELEAASDSLRSIIMRSP